MAKRSKKKRKVGAERAAKAQDKKAQGNQRVEESQEEQTGGFILNEELSPARATRYMPPFEVPRGFVWALGIFIGLAAIISPYGQTSTGYNPDIHVSAYYQTGALLMMLFYFVFLMRKNDNCVVLIPRSPLVLPVVALFLWMAVSVLWVPSLYEGLLKVIDWGSAVLVFLLIVMLIRDAKSFKILLLCTFLSGFIISLLGFAQYLFSVDWVHQHQAPAATFGNKNMAAQYMVATIPFGLCLLLNEREKWMCWLLSIGSACMLTFLYYTHTRGSWFSFMGEGLFIILALILFSFLHKQKIWTDWNKVLSVIGMLVLFAVMINFTPNTFVSEATMGIDRNINPSGRAVQTQSISESANLIKEGFYSSQSQRFTMWENTMEMIKDHLVLGTGIGGWMVYYPKYQAAVREDLMLVEGFFHINAHNDYLELVSELGMVGLAIILWIAAMLLISIWRILMAPHLDANIRVAVLAPIVAFSGIAATAIVSFPLQQATTIMYITMCLGCIAVSYWQAGGHVKGPYRIRFPKFASRAAVAIVLLVGTSVAAATHYNWFVAETNYRNAVSSMRTGRNQDLGRYAKLAVEQHPLRKHMSLYLANYYIGRKEYRKAVRNYERVREDYPYRIEVMQNLGVAYINTKQMDKAREIFELWASIQPHSMQALVSLGIFYSRIGEKEKAIETLERADTLYKTRKQQTQKWTPHKFTEKPWARFEKDHQKGSLLLKNLKGGGATLSIKKVQPVNKTVDIPVGSPEVKASVQTETAQ